MTLTLLATLTTPITLSLPFQAQTHEPGTDPVVTAELPQEPNEWRSYDLTGIRLREIDWEDEGRSLMPNSSTLEIGHESIFHESDQSTPGDFVASLLMELYGPEFEYEGRVLELDDRGRAIVVGPTSLHDRVDAVIGFLESSVSAEARVQVDLLTLPMGVDLPANGRMSQEAATAWVENASARGGHTQSIVGIGGQDAAVLDMSTRRRLVIDYDVEIAQGAAIGDPIIAELREGTRLELHAEPTGDGLLIAGIWQQSGPASITERALRLGFRAGSETGGLHTVQDVSSIQGYHLATGSVGWNAYMPDGDAILVSSARPDGGSNVAVIRRVGGGLAVMRDLPLNQAGARLVAVHLGHTRPTRVNGHGALLEAGPWSLGRGIWFQDNEVVGASVAHGDTSMVQEMLGWDYETSELITLGDWAFIYPHADALAKGDERVAKEIDSRLERLERLGSVRDQFEVRVTLLAKGRPALTSSAPVRTGTAALLVAGSEHSIIPDYDVEVAQFSAVPDPQVNVQFDGMLVWARPKLMANGDLTLELRGGVTRIGEAQEQSLGSSLLGFVDQDSIKMMVLQERRTLSPSPAGGWELRVGDEGGAFTVDVRVTQLQ